MSTFWKIFGIFTIIWLIWYWTGGPQRSTNLKPYVKYNYDSNMINKSDTSLEDGAREMIPSVETNQGLDILKNNLQNQNFTN